LAPGIQNQPSDVLQFDFVDVDEAVFQDVERPLERIFNILGIQKAISTKSP
jgi:shikimate kinase